VGATQVLLALGGAVVVLGIALIYTTAFLAMDDWAQLTTPYLFPLVFLGLFLLLVRRHRPLWEREVAAFVTLATLGIALAASYAGSGDADPEAWGTVASAVVVVASGVILILHRPRLRAAGVGLLSGLVVGANFAAAWIGVDGADFRRLELALAAGCLVAGVWINRTSEDAASLPFAAAVALIVVASIMGISEGFEEDITGSACGTGCSR
jgi:peptidoglycan/LPS O-acetylase OafA/YrhL